MASTETPVVDTTVPVTDLNYGIDDIPKPFPKALGLGLQHVLTMFGATIAVPLLLRDALGFDAGQTAILISSVFIASGLATLVQVYFGSRLPIVQGVSFAFLAAFFAIIGQTGGGAPAMQAIAGAILLGAVFEIFVGYSTLIGRLRRLVTPVVIAPTIALIGLALYGAAAGQAGGNWWVALLTFVLIIVFSLVLAPKVRMFSLFPILLAVVAAYLLTMIASYIGWIGDANAAHLTGATIGDTVASSPWIRNPGDLIFPWGAPTFNAGFLVAVLAAYVVSMIESFGDYHSVAQVSGLHAPSPDTINKGIGAEGIGCAITGFVGGFASTSYTENIGLIGLTKVASRYVVGIGAVALIVLGLITKVGAIVATIPGPVVGGVYLALFGLIAAVGLSNLQKVDLNSQRNLMIIGSSLFMGLVVPSWFAGLSEPFTLGPTWLSDMISSVGSSGMAVGAFWALVMDNLIPGTDEERGIAVIQHGEHEIIDVENVPGDQKLTTE